MALHDSNNVFIRNQHFCNCERDQIGNLKYSMHSIVITIM